MILSATGEKKGRKEGTLCTKKRKGGVQGKESLLAAGEGKKKAGTVGWKKL